MQETNVTKFRVVKLRRSSSEIDVVWGVWEGTSYGQWGRDGLAGFRASEFSAEELPAVLAGINCFDRCYALVQPVYYEKEI